MAIDLSIIVVSWNVWDLLRACLTSLENVSRSVEASGDLVRRFGPVGAGYTLEVIVVDNAGEDATVDLLPSRFPWVQLLRSEENLGFTGGNNLGYTASRGRFVLFLNPDTELIETASGDSLWRLYQAISKDSTIGMVGPQLRYPDNSMQSSRRRFPTRLSGFFESTWLGQLWPDNPWARHLHMADWPASFSHDVDWLVGAAILARREALEDACPAQSQGPFDVGFFMYSEELDLCRRIKQAGWRVVFVPDAVVVHYEGRSSDQVGAARHIYFNTSKVYYYQKYFGLRWANALRRYLLLEFRWQLWQERAKWLVGHKRPLRAQRIATYKQVLASRLEPELGEQPTGSG